MCLVFWGRLLIISMQIHFEIEKNFQFAIASKQANIVGMFDINCYGLRIKKSSSSGSVSFRDVTHAQSLAQKEAVREKAHKKQLKIALYEHFINEIK